MIFSFFFCLFSAKKKSVYYMGKFFQSRRDAETKLFMVFRCLIYVYCMEVFVMGYSFEQPLRGGSNKYPQSMFVIKYPFFR